MASSDGEDCYGDSLFDLDDSEIQCLLQLSSSSNLPQTSTSSNSTLDTLADTGNETCQPNVSYDQDNASNNEDTAIHDTTRLLNLSQLDNSNDITDDSTTSHRFEIPRTTLFAALSSMKQGTRFFWSHSLYAGPEAQRVRVHYCTSHMQSELLARKFLLEPVLGFDLEWRPRYRPGIKNNVSLIQLASERDIGLFHIAMHYGTTAKQLMAPSLLKILESPKILKTGVNIVNADGNRLRKFFRIEPKGLFELSHLHKVVQHSEKEPHLVKKSLVSLAKLVEIHLRLPLLKGPVRMSDWTRPLNSEQKDYAASDAYAGYQLFRVMDKKRNHLHPVPPLPSSTDLTFSTGKTPVKVSEYKPRISGATEAGNHSTMHMRFPSLPLPVSADDARLIQALENQRLKIAQELDISPCAIISNTILASLVIQKPSNESELMAIRGIGPVKAKTFGRQWLDIISPAHEACKTSENRVSANEPSKLSSGETLNRVEQGELIRNRRFIPPASFGSPLYAINAPV